MNTNHDQILLINKPIEWTSFDVVNKLRRKLKIKKIGHAGTLDPLATGLLILCTGKMTKRIEEFQGQEKEYTGSLILGKSTPSHDAETEVDAVCDISGILDDDIYYTTKKFVGKIKQVPPIHSAIKVNGKRAYSLARKGKQPELNPREVTISAFEITSIERPVVNFKVVCSKGTYIRSLVRDFGNELGVGAYLSVLCRTRIGEFLLKDALKIDEINPIESI
jgi:tRNA pseudouridine55 synthase